MQRDRTVALAQRRRAVHDSLARQKTTNESIRIREYRLDQAREYMETLYAAHILYSKGLEDFFKATDKEPSNDPGSPTKAQSYNGIANVTKMPVGADNMILDEKDIIIKGGGSVSRPVAGEVEEVDEESTGSEASIDVESPFSVLANKKAKINLKRVYGLFIYCDCGDHHEFFLPIADPSVGHYSRTGLQDIAAAFTQCGNTQPGKGTTGRKEQRGCLEAEPYRFCDDSQWKCCKCGRINKCNDKNCQRDNPSVCRHGCHFCDNWPGP